jgi:acetylglutamate/LysW-gamma-L-alpha-aminoadipate kinase
VGLLKKFPDESTLISRIPKGERQVHGIREGRMKKKVMGAVEAIDEGVGKVIFADGASNEPSPARSQDRVRTLVNECRRTGNGNRNE